MMIQLKKDLKAVAKDLKKLTQKCVIVHRKVAEGAEGYLFFAFRWPRRIGSATYGTEEAEKQKDPAKADYSSNSFTIRTMPSLIRGTLKFKSSPNLRPDNLRYVPG